MKYTVKIQPAGVSYKSEDNLLDDALSQSIPLEHSCKTGDCGMCSATVLDGSVVNESGNVVNSGGILTCQSKALTDVTLAANYYPELVDIQLQTVPCKVARFEYVTDDIVVLYFRFPPTAKFDYLPGQYVDLSFKGTKRSYSIANAKSDTKELELHIRKVPDGVMSDMLFHDLKVNQLMRIEGPKGTFFVREENSEKSTKPIIFLAGGTGIAPIKAIIEKLNANDDKRPLYVYWGMPNEGSFYLKELSRLQAEKDNFQYVPVCSGEIDSWSGRTGLVHKAVSDDFHSLSEYEVYACGSPLMIDAAKQAFSDKGLPENAFFSDAFTPAK